MSSLSRRGLDGALRLSGYWSRRLSLGRWWPLLLLDWFRFLLSSLCLWILLRWFCLMVPWWRILLRLHQWQVLEASESFLKLGEEVLDVLRVDDKGYGRKRGQARRWETEERRSPHGERHPPRE